MNVYDLGHIPWLDTQLLYHAMPRVGEEGLLILAPSSPYVCIGWHQDADADVDLDYCRNHDIPVFRREVGGGAVFLDGNQIFFQLVLHKDNPLARGDKATLYERLLAPVVSAYGDLGVNVAYRPINDIVTSAGQKISGTGAAEIADSVVLVGNLIEDFDYATMTRVLRVPDEKFRDKVFQSMQANLTTLRRETGQPTEWSAMSSALTTRFAEILGPLYPGVVSGKVREKADEISSEMHSQAWLHRRSPAPGNARDVKIATGVNVVQRVHKASGGLIRAFYEVTDGRFVSVSLSGDFFSYPSDGTNALEATLVGAEVASAGALIDQAYATGTLETPGVDPADWREVLAL